MFGRFHEAVFRLWSL